MGVGNKSDLGENRQVPYEDAEEMANNLGITGFETSAKDATNVDQAFYHIANQAIQNKVHKTVRPKSESVTGSEETRPITRKQTKQRMLRSIIKMANDKGFI